MMEHSEHTATDANNPASTPSNQTWPLWLSDSKAATVQIRLYSLPGWGHNSPAFRSMIWMRGLLTHGSGFTEQVLAKSNHNDWGHTGTRLLNGSLYRLWRGAKTGKVYVSFIGKREHTNPDDSPSTSAPLSEPQKFYGSTRMQHYGQPPWWS